MPSPNSQPMISEAIESAKRAQIVRQLKEPVRHLKKGHRWKLICDLENNQATLEVDIGQWWQKKRAFYPSHEFKYDVPFKAGRNTVTYELDIKGRIEESYRNANEKGRVAGEEAYDDILIEAHVEQSHHTDHKQIIATHPSMKFGTMQNGRDFQFMTAWNNPSFRNEWSAPFTPKADLKLCNTAIYLFEEEPEISYSIFEVDGGHNRLNSLSHESLTPRSSKRIRFQLTPTKLTLTPPRNLNLKTFIVDPKFGHGD